MIWINLAFFINKGHFFHSWKIKSQLFLCCWWKQTTNTLSFLKLILDFLFSVMKWYNKEISLSISHAAFVCIVWLQAFDYGDCLPCYLNEFPGLAGTLSIMKQEWNVRLRPSWITGNSSLNSKASWKGPQHQFWF